MNPNIGLDESSRKSAWALLNEILADEFVLYTKTLNYHWNVTGKDFYELHEFFGKQYAELAEAIDDIAERVRTLGGRAAGSLKEFLALAHGKEDSKPVASATTMITSLLRDHEDLIRRLRDAVDACAEKYHDAGTADFLTGLMEQHEKMAWMLRSFMTD